MSTSSMTPAQRLEAGILYRQVEPSPELALLLNGQLPFEKYRAEVGQRFLFQKGFEQILEAYRHLEPRISHVVTEDHFHAAAFREDVLFLGDDPEKLRPVPSIPAFLKWLTRTSEDHGIVVLAAHHVIEASHGDGPRIADAARRAYGFAGTDGLMHLFPYGDDREEAWEFHVAALNENDYTEKELVAMIAAGRKTIEFINAIVREAHALV
ncbi:hypothetical protein GC173_00575 [bacterium]|nr:hypothetical protein [bacterium]